MACSSARTETPNATSIRPINRTPTSRIFGATHLEIRGAREALRINDLQIAGTHNSYHRRSSWTPLSAWMYARAPLTEQLETQGVRALELDTHYDETNDSIGVFHVPTFDDETTCDTLSQCLEQVRRWSDAHPTHLPLFIQIEVKDDEFDPPSDYRAYADSLDRVVLDSWPRERIVTPDDVQGRATTLRQAVTTRGWPTLSAARGKALFFLDDRAEFYDAYTRGGTSCRGRMLFPASLPAEPLGAFVIVNEPGEAVTEAVAQGFIVRSRVDERPAPSDYEHRRKAALRSGAHILSTDYPVGTDGVPAFRPFGSSVGRCNPITVGVRCATLN
jgi:hypothetical protein